MSDRESILPLAVSLLLAAALHVAAIAGYGVASSAGPEPARSVKPDTRPDLVAVSIKPAGESTNLPDAAALPTHHPVVLSARVINATAHAVPAAFFVEWFIDDRSVQRRVITADMADRAAIADTLTWTQSKPGLRRVRVLVDGELAIDEVSERNNEYETALVWKDPGGEGEPSVADLAVAALHVGEPRIAGTPTQIVARIANLGAAAGEPIRVAVLIDGELHAQGEIAGGLGAGSLADIALSILVAEAGEHEITVIADPAGSIADADPANNRLSRKLEFEPAERKINVGRLEPSPVQINWISHDDYRDLLAEQQRFDQAVVQAKVDPVPVQATPVDPTPPSPAPSPSPSQPAAESRPIAESQPQAVVKPTPEPKPPAQPTDPLDPAERETKRPTPLPEAEPDPVAAPIQKPQPTPPAAIKPTPERSPEPEPVIDRTPAKTADPAPPQKLAPSREVAIVTPPIPEVRTPDASLPAPSDRSAEMRDRLESRAPEVEPKAASDAPNLSDLVEAALARPIVPAAPLEPETTKPASPPVDAIIPPDPQREREADARPVEPVKTPVDGVKPQPEPREPRPESTPRPARPEASDRPAQPTVAPRDTREAPPVTRIETLLVQPGRVVARTGLKINTFEPRPDATTVRTMVPHNPHVIVTFDNAGRVVNAQFERSTGSAAWDAALLNSFYKYTAEGPLLQEVGKTFEVPMRIIFGRR